MHKKENSEAFRKVRFEWAEEGAWTRATPIGEAIEWYLITQTKNKSLREVDL